MPLKDNINDREKDKFGYEAGRHFVYTRNFDLQANQFNFNRTTITTSPTKIVFPSEGSNFDIYHVDASVLLWLGNGNSIVADSASTFPLSTNMVWSMDVQEGNSNNFYAITSTGTIDIFVVGVEKQ